MNLKKQIDLSNVSVVFVTIISAITFSVIFYKQNIASDLKVHIQGLILLLSNKSFPIPPLYFFSVYLLAKILNDSSFFIAAIIILSASVAYKFIITKNILTAQFQSNYRLPYFLTQKNYAVIISIAIIFLAPLTYTTRFYLGKIGINVWHNSTTIFLMPFAVLLFYKSYCFLIGDDKRFPWALLFLAIINILIKPSYFFVFACCFPFFTIIKFKFSKKTFYSLLIIIIGAVLLFAEFYLLYKMSNFNYGRQDKTSIIISPLYVWHRFSSNIPADFFLSILFPLTVTFFYFHEVKKNKLVIYAVLNFIVSVLIFIFISETGARAFDGNFGWQAIVCNYLLFMSYAVFFFKKFLEIPKWNFKNIFIMAAFMLHLLTGILYLAKYMVVGSYR